MPGLSTVGPKGDKILGDVFKIMALMFKDYFVLTAMSRNYF